MTLISRGLALATILLSSIFLAGSATAQTSYILRSPDRRTEISIRTDERIRYGVSFNGKSLLQESTLSITIDQTTLGAGPRVKGAKERSVNEVIEPAVRQKFARLVENYNELRLEFEGDYAVVFRAYNEGVAYRFETVIAKPEVKVQSEQAAFNFAGDYRVFYPKEESIFSHNERIFTPMRLKEIAPTDIASIPAVVESSDGVKIAISDADVEDYPGLWLRGTKQNGLEAMFPNYPTREEAAPGRNQDRDIKVVERANLIAITKGTRTFPWRLIGLAAKDADLITNQLVYLLARPSQVVDTSWIKPGKVAWDWWNANNIHGVDFKSGVNTETYKYYIDFASKHGIEYIILDEGWYKLGNVLEVVPEMNIDELAAYAKQKNVGLILWVVWKTFDDQLEPAFAQFEKWGIKGIKVDFMQRDDQPVMAFYQKICREAAKRKMLVDFHGAIRPILLARTWPNLVTTEGVRGLEWNKWSNTADPEHNLTLPFTRMFLGPMDYTPGAMQNAAKSSFAQIFERPMSMGTRAHQLAMYVVFESPLQMLSDTPSNYMREPDSLEFLSAVPTVWDDTKVLDAKIGDYVVVARRKGREWYVGAMTDWTARELEVDLSFLPEGTFTMDSYQDGVNAARYGNDFKRVKSKVSRESKLKIKLAEGGGWAARIL
jgi:alpha-glucosidase